MYVQLLREFELIGKSHISVTIKKSVIVACFFVSDRLSAINYDNKTTRHITSSSDTFISFQISLASRYVTTFSLTVEFLKKKRRAEEESSLLISKIRR